MSNDTPPGVPGGCGREGCGHSRDDHYQPRGWGDTRYVNRGKGPCNVRGKTHHCICYDWKPAEAKAS